MYSTCIEKLPAQTWRRSIYVHQSTLLVLILMNLIFKICSSLPPHHHQKRRNVYNHFVDDENSHHVCKISVNDLPGKGWNRTVTYFFIFFTVFQHLIWTLVRQIDLLNALQRKYTRSIFDSVRVTQYTSSLSDITLLTEGILIHPRYRCPGIKQNQC